jgi:hypothetical protein
VQRCTISAVLLARHLVSRCCCWTPTEPRDQSATLHFGPSVPGQAALAARAVALRATLANASKPLRCRGSAPVTG